MKWKANPVPEHGDEGWTIRFAFFPKRCSDGYMRWLCVLYVRQQFASYGELAGTSWVDVEHREHLPAGT